MAKKRSMLDRAFTAARYWVGKRGYFGEVEDREDHFAYRSGWAAGYATARRELSPPKPKGSLTNCDMHDDESY